mgnify:CR=1 FL=1
MTKTIEHEHASTYTYKCEHCGNEFPDEDMALKCEKSHSKKEIKKFDEERKRREERKHNEWVREFCTGRDCS